MISNNKVYIPKRPGEPDRSLADITKIKSIKQIIVFTSDKVYKNSESFFLNESSPLGGLDPYSSSKSCQDIISASFFLEQENNRKTVIIIITEFLNILDKITFYQNI